MARPYRLQGEGYLYHITSRGDDRKRIYISEYDYEKFLEYLLKAKEKYNFYLYAYCLMTNHYHLLIETTQPNLSRIMQYINTAYTVYYNKKRNRSGHLFQGRYKSIIVDGDSYFLELTRYIHLNPVRAGVSKTPEGYKWSSFNEYITDRRKTIIDKKEIKKYIKINPSRYKQFVLDGIDKKPDILDKVYAGFVLGGVKFIKDTIKDLKQQKGGEISYKKKLTNYISVDEIVKETAELFKRLPEEVYAWKKKPLLARKAAIYLSKRLTGLTNKEIGEAFKITYSAVSKSYRDMEKIMEERRRIRRDIETIISHFKV
ncbi:MAG: transposase [candidate division WOR-3 bacterium]